MSGMTQHPVSIVTETDQSLFQLHSFVVLTASVWVGNDTVFVRAGSSECAASFDRERERGRFKEIRIPWAQTPCRPWESLCVAAQLITCPRPV